MKMTVHNTAATVNPAMQVLLRVVLADSTATGDTPNVDKTLPLLTDSPDCSLVAVKLIPKAV